MNTNMKSIDIDRAKARIRTRIGPTNTKSVEVKQAKNVSAKVTPAVVTAA